MVAFRKEKGERRKEKGERRKEKGEREKGEKFNNLSLISGRIFA
jgi:hypothetical protein